MADTTIAEADAETFDLDDEISELSSSPSIPDGDIDFNFVYALHTFLATVEGQATSQKGDTLDLLDDTNSYWWLVRNLKDQSIGYLPAEHIETPSERLARLNKHRNVDNGAYLATDPVASVAKSSKFARLKTRKSAKAVAFGSPKVIEYDTYFSDSESESDYLGLAGENDRHNQAAVSEPLVQSIEVEDTVIEDSYAKNQFARENQDVRKYTLTPTPAAGSDTTLRTRQSSITIHDTKLSPSGAIKLHAQKDSQGSHYSEMSTISSVDEHETKDKKKKGVFSGLFKKRSKKEKHNTIESVSTESVIHSSQPVQNSVDPTLGQLHVSSPNLELPMGVQEMRSSVLMNIDPVTAEMIEEPAHRGPVDEVEMMHAQRISKSPAQVEPNSPMEPLGWNDAAIACYLSADTPIHGNLILMVKQQAKLEIAKNRNKPADMKITAFDDLDTRLGSMMKELDALLTAS